MIKEAANNEIKNIKNLLDKNEVEEAELKCKEFASNLYKTNNKIDVKNNKDEFWTEEYIRLLSRIIIYKCCLVSINEKITVDDIIDNFEEIYIGVNVPYERKKSSVSTMILSDITMLK